MLSLGEQLEKSGVSSSTAKTYLSNLYTLNNKQPFRNLAFLRKIDNILTAMKPYADSTQKTLLASIVSVLSLFKDKPTYKKLYTRYQDLMNEKVKEENAKPKNEKSKKQEANWISWDEVQEIKDKLFDKIKDIKKQATIEQRKKLLDYFVLSLYTDIPPRRNQDYQVMYVVKKWDKSLPDDRNYLSLEDHKMIFNKYKTAKTYGQHEISFADNEDFKKALGLYLRYHPLHSNRMGKKTMFPLLVKSDGTPFSSINGITRLLHSIFKKKVGSSMLRHIYLTNKYGDKLGEMEKDSRDMAHSISQQKEYIKHKDNGEGEDKEEENIRE